MEFILKYFVAKLLIQNQTACSNQELTSLIVPTGGLYSSIPPVSTPNALQNLASSSPSPLKKKKGFCNKTEGLQEKKY